MPSASPAAPSAIGGDACSCCADVRRSAARFFFFFLVRIFPFAFQEGALRALRFGGLSIIVTGMRPRHASDERAVGSLTSVVTNPSAALGNRSTAAAAMTHSVRDRDEDAPDG